MRLYITIVVEGGGGGWHCYGINKYIEGVLTVDTALTDYKWLA